MNVAINRPKSDVAGFGRLAPPPVYEDVRTTVIIPHALDRNLQVLSVQSEKGKNDLIKEALREFIVPHNLNPDAIPRITVTYE